MDTSLKQFVKDAEGDPRKYRITRAMMGLANGQMQIEPFVAGKLWAVTSSMSGKSREYLVVHDTVPGYDWACSCPDWRKRRADCKHVMAVRLLVEQRV